MATKKKATKVQNLMDQMAGISAEVKSSDGALARISEIAKVQFDQMLEVARLEDALKEAKKRLFTISTVDLPEAMKEAGIEEFTTTDGLEIKTKQEIQCGIPAARREEAYEWLIKHDFGGIIKSDLELLFDREEREKAEKLAEALTKKGYTVTLNSTIHAQTLKSFVKERMADTESDVEFPLDLFGVFPFTVAAVKPKKTRVK